MEEKKAEEVLAFELRMELFNLVNEVQRCTRQVAMYNYNGGDKEYPDLYADACDELARVEGKLKSKIRDLCQVPHNEVYRCLAQERAQAVAMQEAHATAIMHVVNSYSGQMEEKRREYIAKIEALEA